MRGYLSVHLDHYMADTAVPGKTRCMQVRIRHIEQRTDQYRDSETIAFHSTCLELFKWGTRSSKWGKAGARVRGRLSMWSQSCTMYCECIISGRKQCLDRFRHGRRSKEGGCCLDYSTSNERNCTAPLNHNRCDFRQATDIPSCKARQ